MRRNTIFRYIALCFLTVCFFYSVGYSQIKIDNPEVTVTANFTRDSVMIGDQFALRVFVNGDIMQSTGFPTFEKGIGGAIEVLSESGVDTVSRNGRNVTLRKDYYVTCFDGGNYNFGQFRVLNYQNNMVDTVFTADSLRLFVGTMVIDTTKNIVDIRAQIDAPLQFVEIQSYFYYGLVALVIFIAIGFLVYLYIKKQKLKARIIPLLPPHIEAMNELEQLYALKLWSGGRHKVYFTRLSDIIRVYIERRYEVAAMEMTTDEIFISLKSHELSKDMDKLLKEFLSLSDLVKFAKYVPDEQENEHSFKQAYNFVVETKLTAMDSDKEIK